MLNYDVITLICAEVSGKKDLLHLGLASKHWFLEPALNVLWKKIEDMEPLLSVLPETTLVNGNKVRVEHTTSAQCLLMMIQDVFAANRSIVLGSPTCLYFSCPRIRRQVGIFFLAKADCT